jgi:hypothetical protein
MAQYKVIQDIEAEDKLLGPLTLKQFIYAGITIFLGFIAYKLAGSLHSGLVIILFLPEILFFGLLATPFGIDQPNEVWLLAKIRFYLKPQIRKWDQDGIGSLLTISAPKKIEKKLTKNFSASEAKGRLESLAKILDSGGGVNPSIGPSTYTSNLLGPINDDRLVNLSTISNGQPTTDIVDQDDIFDENNLAARHIDGIVFESEKKLRDYQRDLVNRVDPPKSSSDPSIVMGTVSSSKTKDYLVNAPVEPAIRPIESSFKPTISNQVSSNQNLVKPESQPSMTSQADSAKISLLARDNNLSVSSIKRELKGGDDSGEVVITLH